MSASVGDKKQPSKVDLASLVNVKLCEDQLMYLKNFMVNASEPEEVKELYDLISVVSSKRDALIMVEKTSGVGSSVKPASVSGTFNEVKLSQFNPDSDNIASYLQYFKYRMKVADVNFKFKY